MIPTCLDGSYSAGRLSCLSASLASARCYASQSKGLRQISPLFSLLFLSLWPVVGHGPEPVRGEAYAQEASSNPLGQPTEHYYGAWGAGVRVHWELERDSVKEGEVLLATLVVERVRNPQQVQRPDLRKLEAFARQFEWIEPQPPPEVDLTSGQVRFPYRLRPRHRGVTEVPPLLFHYFNPSAPEGRQYPLTTAPAVTLRVLPAPSSEGPSALPLQAEEFWFQLVDGDRYVPPSVGKKPFAGLWLASLVLGPLAAWSWYRLWRWWFPDAQRLARLQRSRLARNVVRQLERIRKSSQPWQALHTAVVYYIQKRWNLPPGWATPAELVAVLRDQNIPGSLLSRLEHLLQEWERRRFAPQPTPSQIEPEIQAAIELLLRLEEL